MAAGHATGEPESDPLSPGIRMPRQNVPNNTNNLFAMAAAHATAHLTRQDVHDQISRYKFCPFFLEEYWDQHLPKLVPKSLITDLVNNYHKNKFASYCQLVADIINRLRIDPNCEDRIVKLISEFIPIARILSCEQTDSDDDAESWDRELVPGIINTEHDKELFESKNDKK
jgi:hypothetical protein